jgi:hypothetical protein
MNMINKPINIIPPMRNPLPPDSFGGLGVLTIVVIFFFTSFKIFKYCYNAGLGTLVGLGMLVGLGTLVGLGMLVGFGTFVGLGTLVGLGMLVGFGTFVGLGTLVGVGCASVILSLLLNPPNTQMKNSIAMTPALAQRNNDDPLFFPSGVPLAVVLS